MPTRVLGLCRFSPCYPPAFGAMRETRGIFAGLLRSPHFVALFVIFFSADFGFSGFSRVAWRGSLLWGFRAPLWRVARALAVGVWLSCAPLRYFYWLLLSAAPTRGVLSPAFLFLVLFLPLFSSPPPFFLFFFLSFSPALCRPPSLPPFFSLRPLIFPALSFFSPLPLLDSLRVESFGFCWGFGCVGL